MLMFDNSLVNALTMVHVSKKQSISHFGYISREMLSLHVNSVINIGYTGKDAAI